MFRRKEDSLFDDVTDSSQSSDAADTTSSASAPVSGATAAFNQPASRTAESRPAAVPNASAFRGSSSTLSSDMSRNRMPEAKSSMATAGIPSSTSMNAVEKSNKSGKRVLTVGNDILLKGEIATCDRLVIEGKVDATLNDVHTVEIAESGSFKGSAHIEDAEISGLFEGDLIVRNRLIIYATGKVRGKITYGEIEIERGGEMTGEIKTGSSSGSAASRPARQTKDDKVAA